MQELITNHRLRLWLATVGTATLIIGASYTMVQQATRQGADDLPLSTAQNVHQELQNGMVATDVVPTLKVDLRHNSSVFVTVTDADKHILASSATLDGQPSLPPAGTFSYTAVHGTDHFTWQPTNGIRLATRMMSYGTAPNNGYIITGQSLAQAENHIGTYGLLALLAWLAMLAWTTLLILLPRGRAKKNS